MSILNTKVSWFKSTKQTDVQPSFPISSFIDLIKGNKFKEKIDKVRAGDKSIKTQLPTVAFHGMFEYSRKASNFIEASGLIILDIDDVDVEKLEDMKQEIMDSSDSVFAVMVSPSGNGIKVLYYVEPDTITKDNYKAIGKEVISNFADYGKVDFLSITDCLIMTHDSNILINEDVEPDNIHIKEVEVNSVELESRDSSKNLWDDAESFFEVVLDQQIIQRVTSNFHYIQVSILELAKFGFKHPATDLEFVVHYSESHFKVSKDNKQRFIEATELAKTYQQTRWAYDTRVIEQESVEIDYSSFQDDEVGMTLYDNEEVGSDEEILEEDETGVIDYSKLYKSVVETILEGDRVGREISLSNFANVMRFRGTGILTITGIPGHGKTEFVDQILVDLARMYNESSLIVGFEQTPEEHIIKLSRKMIGSNITCDTWWHEKNEIVFKENYNFITKKIQHIDVKKTGGKIENLLMKSAEWVQQQRRLGEDPKYVVIDPFNMLSTSGKVSGYEKAEEILRQLTHFSHQMGVLVILVAHPFKMKKDEKTGEYEIPDFYSVKGSSAFFEMSYHGLTIYRTNGMVLVRVLKVKQNNMGDAGSDVWFKYDKQSGRYTPCDEEGLEMIGDHRDKNWLSKVTV
jgi:hypothetical protein